MRDTKRIKRREFLSIATWGTGGLIGAAMGIPAGAYIIGPALKDEPSKRWTRLGGTSKVEFGTPTLFKVKNEWSTR